MQRAPNNILTEGISVADQPSEDAIYRNVNLRIIPFIFVCYVVAYLDRINIGFVKLQMQDALKFDDAVYGLGAGIFFIGYVLFEVPSNVMLKRIGAKKTLGRIMLLWGIAGCCMALVRTPLQFYVCRFLLGAFEAGFVPGAIYLISCWYPSKRRGAALGVFLTGIPIAGVVGGPVSAWTMTRFDGLAGWDGWQWSFVIQALPAIVLGVIGFFLLDDGIETARWLSDAERRIVSAQVAAEIGPENSQGRTRIADFGDFRLYAMGLAYFTFICGTYVLSFWLPTLLRHAGLKDNLSIGLYSAIPFAVSVLGMVLLCRSSDRTMERRWHTALCAIAGAAALAAIPYVPNTLLYACILLSIATTAIYATVPLFWAMPSDYFAGSPGAAGSLALVNSVGLIGGFVSPFAIGWIKALTGSLVWGLYSTSVLLLAGGIALLIAVPKRLLHR